MKSSLTVILLGTLLLLLAACGPSNDNKPMLEQERATLNKAKQMDNAQQQQAQQQQQEADKQTQ